MGAQDGCERMDKDYTTWQCATWQSIVNTSSDTQAYFLLSFSLSIQNYLVYI